MNPEAICDKLADISEEVCQLRSGVGKTSDGLATDLANFQETTSAIRRNVSSTI